MGADEGSRLQVDRPTPENEVIAADPVQGRKVIRRQDGRLEIWERHPPRFGAWQCTIVPSDIATVE